ncbi:MAG: twin-arginine translocase subunit TatC [Verrucomicrobia bacterium]|nr:twin-arginine translocase subunit TatC [Verrucomicrobiota bacterium]
MATKPEELDQPADVVEAEEEEGGGPVKTFLEHLEDLRWMLIKCVVAVLVAMLVCLVGGKYLVTFLTWPLNHAPQFLAKADKSTEVPVLLGTNVLGRLPPATLDLPANETNRFVLRLLPKADGTNLVLAMQLDTQPPDLKQSSTPGLITLGPLSPILVALKLAIYGGLILASPFLLYFIGQFVLPALKVREKSILFRAVAFGSVLFFIGVAFCYLVVSGFALMATVQFSEWMGFGAEQWRAEEYITFMCRFMLGMGLAFELPVVILTLVKIELLDYEQLVRFRQYAIVGNLVLAAFATPSGDPFTMFLMAIPLQFLYEISVLVAWYWKRKERKQAALAGQTASS